MIRNTRSKPKPGKQLSTLPPWVEAATDRLDEMTGLSVGWNGYAAPPPIDGSVALTKRIIRVFADEGIQPTRIAPSVVGGVGITFRQANRRAYVEIDNAGAVYLLLSDKESQPSTSRIENGKGHWRKLVRTIRAHIDG